MREERARKISGGAETRELSKAGGSSANYLQENKSPGEKFLLELAFFFVDVGTSSDKITDFWMVCFVGWRPFCACSARARGGKQKAEVVWGTSPLLRKPGTIGEQITLWKKSGKK